MYLPAYHETNHDVRHIINHPSFCIYYSRADNYPISNSPFICFVFESVTYELSLNYNRQLDHLAWRMIWKQIFSFKLNNLIKGRSLKQYQWTEKHRPKREHFDVKNSAKMSVTKIVIVTICSKAYTTDKQTTRDHRTY